MAIQNSPRLTAVGFSPHKTTLRLSDELALEKRIPPKSFDNSHQPMMIRNMTLQRKAIDKFGSQFNNLKIEDFDNPTEV